MQAENVAPATSPIVLSGAGAMAAAATASKNNGDLGLPGPAWACLAKHGPAWACLGLPAWGLAWGPAWACLDLPGPAWEPA